MKAAIWLLVLWHIGLVVVEGLSDKAKGRPAYAYTILRSGYEPGLAVDGKTSTFYHSKHQAKNWWAVDLGSRMYINSVAITPYYTYLTSSTIGAMDSRPTANHSPSSYNLCYKHTGKTQDGRRTVYKCKGNTRGRYIVIYVQKSNYLALREVNVYATTKGSGSGNIAKSKSTCASSVLSSSYRISNAVDGNTNTYYRSKHDDTNPWWAVNLGAQRDIKEVAITAEGNYLHSFIIGVADAQPPTRLFPYAYKVCYKHMGAAVKANTRVVYKCQPKVRGRFVIVQIPGRYGYLVLREVEVYAKPVQAGNVAKGKKTYESSHYKNNNQAAKAVDGSFATNAHAGLCAHTKMQTNPWWAVDLGANYVIKKIVIQTRQDCCYSQMRNFVVGVSNQNPASYPPKPGKYTVCIPKFGVAWGRITLSCSTTVQGRYVFVQMPGHDRTLVLCEVEIYTY